MGMFERCHIHPRHLERLLGRSLTGVEDQYTATGERSVVRALNEGQLDVVRAAIQGKRDPLVRPDFVARIEAHLATNATKEFFRYDVDVPARVWHEAARTGRVEGRSFRRVLADYLVRGWEAYTEQRQHADNSRAALRTELRDYRVALDQAAARAAAGGHADRTEIKELAAQQAAVAAAVNRLSDGEAARDNAIVAIIAALQDRKWIPKAFVPQLQRDGWLG
jgi:hypothetical protein